MGGLSDVMNGAIGIMEKLSPAYWGEQAAKAQIPEPTQQAGLVEAYVEAIDQYDGDTLSDCIAKRAQECDINSIQAAGEVVFDGAKSLVDRSVNIGGNAAGAAGFVGVSPTAPVSFLAGGISMNTERMATRENWKGRPQTWMHMLWKIWLSRHRRTKRKLRVLKNSVL